MMLSLRLPVNIRLLVTKFWGSQKLYMDVQLHREVGAPTLHIVQGSGVLYFLLNQQFQETMCMWAKAER